MTRHLSRARRPGLGQAGITAVELSVVLVVVALLAIAAYPSLSNVLQVMASKGAAEQITTAVRLARQFAITRGANHCIEFLPSAPYTQYRIREANTASPPACSGTTLEGPRNIGDPDNPKYGENVTGAATLVFDPIGNRVVPTGPSDTTLTVNTTPASCASTIRVTLYGGVRVAGC